MFNNNIIYESKRYENHELKQLVRDFGEYLKENPGVPPFFKARVESNPYGKGGEQELWFGFEFNGHFSSIFPAQSRINGLDYAWTYPWTDGHYKGSITVTELPKSQFQEPEVIKEGDWVEILESARTVRSDSDDRKEMIGKPFRVLRTFSRVDVVLDDRRNMSFPRYAVKKVPPPEEKVTITMTKKEYQQVQEILKQKKR